jgi:3-methyladenine DNA glycosylase AlkC
MQAEATSSPLLKEIFNRERLHHIAAQTEAVCPGFDAGRFLVLATENLDALAIMQRLRQVATSLRQTLPGTFPEHVGVLCALAPRINHGFASIALPEYVGLYGEAHFDLSMDALRFLTRFGSSEFAVRPFLARDLQRTLAVMEGWARDDNEHVRRLASEGCRPRLPWSFQLKDLIADPTPVGNILEALKSDPSPYVRKSVANHLNDITKDNPAWVLEKLERWPMEDGHAAWIVKHALRSMIKKGEPRALALIGAGGKTAVRIDGFAVAPAAIALGQRVRIDARLVSVSDEPQRLVVDYAVHYVKKSGSPSRKVFKLRTVDLAPGAACELTAGQTVRDFTTRKHYAGHHRIELMVNGEILAEGGFDLAV